MKIAALLGYALLASTACASSSATSERQLPPPAAATQSQTQSPGATPSASVVPFDPSVTSVSFTCRLPVIRTIGGMGGNYQGGFITFPQATLVADPQGGMTGAETSPTVATAATPILHGHPQAGLPFYDAAERRWLPVAAGQSDPTGTAYAYGLNNATIRVVDVRTGVERIFKPNVTPGQFVVKDFDGSAVYFAVDMLGGPQGVWRLDLATGSVTQLVQGSLVLAVRSGTAWVGVKNPADPNPPTLTNEGVVFDSLAALSLTTGEEVVWDYSPGESVSLEGVDADGRPIIEVTDPPDFSSGPVMRIDRPGATRIGGGADIIDARGIGIAWPLTDRDRIWFGNERGIYLYTAAAGLQKVYAFSDNPGADGLFPAGFCR